MPVRSARVRLVTLVVVAGCASASEGWAQSSSGASEYPRDERISHAGLILRRQQEADRLAAVAPESAATVKALVEAGRAEQALDVVERIVRTRPEAIDQALREIRDRYSSFSPTPRESLLAARADALIKSGRAVLAALPLAPTIQQQALSLLGDQSGLSYTQRLASYDRLIREHAGTAVATQLEAWRIDTLVNRWPGAPPYPRRLQIALDAVDRLLAKPDTDPEAVDGALESVLKVSLPYSTVLVDGQADAATVTVMRGFVLGHRTLLQHPRLGHRFQYLAFASLPRAIEAVDSRQAAEAFVAELSTLRPVPVGGRLVELDSLIDREFERLIGEQRFESSAAVTRTADARARLRAMLDEPEPVRQRAHALLAATEFRVGRVRDARTLLDSYVARYPEAGWAWIAALHAAQATQTIESAEAAAERFAAVGRRYAAVPTVPAIAAYYEARALDAAGRIADAADAYGRAVRAWEGTAATWSGLDWPVEFEPFGPVYSTWPREIERTAITRRITELTEARDMAEGPVRARAQWWLQHSQPAPARDALRGAAARRPELSRDRAFTTLLHRAEHDAAVAGAGQGVPGARQARRDLTALCNEPFDPWVGLGCAALASLHAVDGREDQAVATFTRGLAAWQKTQAADASTLPALEPGSVEHDVFAIRDVLFQPRAGGIYGQQRFTTRENGDLPPFLLMPSTITATFVDREEDVIVRATRQPAGITNAVFLDAVERQTLWETAEMLSGCEGRRVTRHARVFEAVVGWSPAYCVLAGSWLTLPVVGRVNFANAERTLAEVPVNTGGGGFTAVMEKTAGTWRLKTITTSWMS